MKRIVVIAVLVAAAGLIVWRFPLFRVVRIKDSAGVVIQNTFNAAEFAESFWRERLIPSLDKAANVTELLTALEENRQRARERFGYSVGVSRNTLFVVQADGTIVTVDRKRVGVAIGDGEGEVDVVIETGPLFGNTVRDATGLLRAGDFSNSQQFNDISAELNRIVETKVIAPLAAEAKVGRRVHVVGCTELANNATMEKPLPLIPLQVRFE
jgi:predicted lipoprotein